MIWFNFICSSSFHYSCIIGIKIVYFECVDYLYSVLTRVNLFFAYNWTSHKLYRKDTKHHQTCGLDVLYVYIKIIYRCNYTTKPFMPSLNYSKFRYSQIRFTLCIAGK